MRRTRNQEFDIDNIVIPYSIAASTRVEQLVYKPIETPRWRVLEYSEIFPPGKDGKLEGELEDMSNAAFLERHNKCEIEEKKRFTQSIKTALNATRKTRRLDSTGRSESISETPALSSSIADDVMAVTPVSSPGKSKDKEPNSGTSVAEENKGTSTPVADTAATVITEAMANQALKSLFKVGGRRRTISTTIKVELEEEEAPVVSKLVDPWPQRKFPLAEEEYKEMVEVMQKSYPDCPVGITSHSSIMIDDPPTSPKCL
jgi:KAT8 regulatory NSL complex subunit 1